MLIQYLEGYEILTNKKKDRQLWQKVVCPLRFKSLFLTAKNLKKAKFLAQKVAYSLFMKVVKNKDLTPLGYSIGEMR